MLEKIKTFYNNNKTTVIVSGAIVVAYFLYKKFKK
ncbi:hypothetical protein CLU81_5326 [Flavobacterium sp. 9]|jgi:hypothetical protein|nr:hypothetical protein CLU81_5326 [Flavobacterium sp. 9]